MSINALSIIPCKTASCSVMGDYAYKKNANRSWKDKKVGDIVLYDFNRNGTSDHTGILERVNKDGTIDVIEGNTSQKSDDNGGNVMRRTRSKATKMYFVRPNYNDKVTAKMVLDTARAQLGTKEKPAGSNNVKYNTWFYGHPVKGDAYPWCMVFVCWLFAHVGDGVEDIPIVAKPTGKYSGTIPNKLIKKGSKGTAVGQWQKFLNWYHPAWKLKEDNAFGAKTEAATKSFQKTEGIAHDGEAGKNTFAKANMYKATSKPATQKPSTPARPKATLKSYRIEIDLTNQIATVYGIYSDGSKKGIMSEFISSARKGKTTPVGNFKIQGASGGRKAKYRTCLMSSKKSYAEYACRFKGAKMMHGVPYSKRNTKGYVSKTEFNKLGSPASAGCVRMPIKLARYIYNTCPVGTPVIVFKGTKGVYPMGKPKKYKATSNVDPTK